MRRVHCLRGSAGRAGGDTGSRGSRGFGDDALGAGMPDEAEAHPGGQEVCGTPEELRMVVQQNQDAAKSIQKLYDAQSK